MFWFVLVEVNVVGYVVMNVVEKRFLAHIYLLLLYTSMYMYKPVEGLCDCDIRA